MTTTRVTSSIATYIAMLRGINVGGRSVKMDQLRVLFTNSGYKEVRTYIQSGNVVFKSTGAAKTIAASIAAKIEAEFGFPVPVLLKRSDDLARIIKANPLPKLNGIDPTKLHVTFLSNAPAKADLNRLEPLIAKGERAVCVGSAVYLYCPHGYGETGLSNNAIEKALGVGATTRNWKTTNILFEMASEV